MLFQFTASYEADHLRISILRSTHIFQFTASYEADRLVDRFCCTIYSFNSQPHTRLTGRYSNTDGHRNLSIHSLIRGWPIDQISSGGMYYLSIHSLIRGWPTGTFGHVNIEFFQFTASYEADPLLIASLSFLLIFQFTASYEADHIRNLLFQKT